MLIKINNLRIFTVLANICVYMYLQGFSKVMGVWHENDVKIASKLQEGFYAAFYFCLNKYCFFFRLLNTHKNKIAYCYKKTQLETQNRAFCEAIFASYSYFIGLKSLGFPWISIKSIPSVITNLIIYYEVNFLDFICTLEHVIDISVSGTQFFFVFVE